MRTAAVATALFPPPTIHVPFCPLRYVNLQTLTCWYPNVNQKLVDKPPFILENRRHVNGPAPNRAARVVRTAGSRGKDVPEADRANRWLDTNHDHPLYQLLGIRICLGRSDRPGPRSTFPAGPVEGRGPGSYDRPSGAIPDADASGDPSQAGSFENAYPRNLAVPSRHAAVPSDPVAFEPGPRDRLAPGVHLVQSPRGIRRGRRRDAQPRLWHDLPPRDPLGLPGRRGLPLVGYPGGYD